MAEIPVEKKSGMKWLWLLLALLLVGLLLWWVLDDDDAEAERVAPVAAVEASVAPEAAYAPAIGAEGDGAVTQSAGMAGDGAGPGANGAAGEANASLAAIMRNPAGYIGRNDFAGEVQVPDVPTDRGFWVEHDGARMFALIVDNPREKQVDINPGQRLRVTKGMVRDASSVGQLPGKPLDADTKRILAEQKAFLLIQEGNIEIVSRANA